MLVVNTRQRLLTGCWLIRSTASSKSSLLTISSGIKPVTLPNGNLGLALVVSVFLALAKAALLGS